MMIDKKVEKIKKAKTYIVFSQFRAGYLMMRGFKLHDMASNKDFPSKNVFFFSNKPELHQALQDLEDNNESINKIVDNERSE